MGKGYKARSIYSKMQKRKKKKNVMYIVEPLGLSNAKIFILTAQNREKHPLRLLNFLTIENYNWII